MADLTLNQRSLVALMTKSDQHMSHGFELILKTDRPEIYFEELKSKGFFAKENNPSPQPVPGNEAYFRVPFWPALKYLTRIASTTSEANDVVLGSAIMQIVREISAPASDERSVDNYHTYAAMTEVMASVPTVCVTLDDVDLVKTFLSSRWDTSLVSSLIGRLLTRFLNGAAEHDDDKAIRLLQHMTEVKPTSESGSSSTKLETVVEPFWLERILKETAREIGMKCCAKGIRCLVERTSQIFGDAYIAEHTWLRRPAIEDHVQNYDWDHSTNALVFCCREALHAFISSDPAEGTGLVRELLTSDEQIARRLALDAIRTNWAVMSEIFESELTPTLFDAGLIHEMYLLLKERFGDFSESCKQDVLTIIANLAPIDSADDESASRMRFRQRNLLHAVRGLGRAAAQQEYDRLEALIGPPSDHPDFLSYHFSGWVSPGKSPYSMAELQAFSEDRSLITRVESYQVPTSDPHASRKGLIDELTKAVQASPELYLWTIEPHVVVRRETQYGLIQGFAKAIEGRTNESPSPHLRTVLDVLLPYLRNLTSDAAFWSEPAEESGRFEPDKDWIPPVIVSTVKNLVSDDDITLTNDDLNHLGDILRDVRRFAVGTEPSGDPMTAAINNPRGVSIEALLQLILRSCRLADKTEGSHVNAWHKHQSDLEEEISGCVQGRRLETSTLVASYLAQLLYVAKEWCGDHLPTVFPRNHPSNFAAAVAGLAFANVSPPVYELLQRADVPRIALANSDITSSTRERLLERIALAFAWGQETLESPLMLEMFAESRLEDLTEIASTMGRWSSEKLSPEQSLAVRSFARKVIAFGLENEEPHRKLLSAASRLIAFVEAPYADDFDWVVAVAPFASAGFGSDHFIEHLDVMAEVDASTTSKVLAAYLQGYSLTYDYEDHLKSTIRKVYAGGERAEAMSIIDRIVKLGGGHEWVALYTSLRDGENSSPSDNHQT